MAKNPLLTIVIPCLNEELTIATAIAQATAVGKKLCKEKFAIIVADNQSTDHTLKVIKKLRKENPYLSFVSVPFRGYGAALHFGIKASKSTWVAFADADLSYDFQDIARLWRVAHQKSSSKKDSSPDLVLGSRLKGQISAGAMPLLNRYLGTPILTWLIRVIYRLPVTDCNSGMRLIKTSFYHRLNMKNSGMEWASELLIRTAIHHGKYAEAPIKLLPDQRKRSPHLLRWADGWRHLKAIVLLKPKIIYYPALIFIFLGIVASQFSTALMFYFFLLGLGLFLAVTAVQLLQKATYNLDSYTARLLVKIPVLSLALIITIIGFGAVLFLPENFPQLRIFLGSCVVLFDMWVFLIETIKTHLVYKLK